MVVRAPGVEPAGSLGPVLPAPVGLDGAVLEAPLLELALATTLGRGCAWHPASSPTNSPAAIALARAC